MDSIALKEEQVLAIGMVIVPRSVVQNDKHLNVDKEDVRMDVLNDEADSRNLIKQVFYRI